ncbi:EamA-like transporter family protein [methanogenic archaeon mixed culture ISO4-G1]|nr:EamA-like transporter family protein [methanogenic archaeon mixed culture ISO4-G1]
MADLESLKQKMIANRYKWGFFWILWASILWGFSYVPQELIFYFEPMSTLYDLGGMDLIESVMIVSALQALMFAVVLFLLWSCVNGKPMEVIRNVCHWPVSKWFLVSAFWGGLMAVFGSYLAVAFIGADFAAAIALLSTVTGAIYGRFLFKEKMSTKLIIGIIITTVGGVLICNPEAIIENMSTPGNEDIWIGYIGGALSAIGWGVETCYNIRGLDVADTEATTAVRYFWEMILWFCIVFPIVGALVGFDTFFGFIGECFGNPAIFGLLVFTSLSLGLADSLLHKGFPLMGAGRALSVNNAVYVPISLLTLWIFLKDYDISLWLVAGSFVAILGTFVMYWEKGEVLDSLREVEDD